MTPDVSVPPLVPQGWRRVQLGELAKGDEAFADGPFGSNLKTEHYSSEGVRVIRLQNIGRGVFLDGDKAFVPPEHFAGLRRHSAEPGDVIVAALGDGARPAGRACVLPPRLGPAMVKADCFRIRLPRTLILPEFLASYLNAPRSLTRVADLMRGATRPRVTLEILKRLEIVLPAVTEQMRIVLALGEATRQVELARAAAEVRLDAARALDASKVREVFTGSRVRAWSCRRLGDVGEIVSGVTLGRSTNGVSTRPVPYLRVANVKDSYLELPSVYKIEATDAEIDRLRLLVGDLLLTEGGDADKLGRGCVWRGEIPECIHQNHVFRVRFGPGEVEPEFVSAQIGSAYGKRYFLAHAKQTTGIATINRTVLAGFPLMVPDLAEQRQIVRTIAEYAQESARLREAAREDMVAIDALAGAWLQRAFSGAL